MSFWEAVILGAIQGFFMFIPVSSTSHLALAQQWLIERGSSIPTPDSPELILFDLIVHVGTLVSVAVVFRHSVRSLLAGAWGELRELGVREWPSSRYLRLSGLGVLAVALTGVIGVVVQRYGVDVFAMPVAITFNLAVTGLILWWTDSARQLWRGPTHINSWVATVVGIAQGIALLPGLSRSGLTIAAALLLGVKRRWAAEFSFFIAIPTIIAGSAVQAWLVYSAGDTLLLAPFAFVVGFVVAAVVGTAALLLVLRLLYQARFRIFSVYVWILAGLVASGTLVYT